MKTIGIWKQRRMAGSWILGACLRTAGFGDELAVKLAQAVDLSSPAERAAAAERMASTATIEQWLAAMKSFGTFATVEPGTHVERVALWNGAKEEETEVELFLPESYDLSKPAALLLQLHETGGTARGGTRLWIQVAEKLGMVVVAPAEHVEKEGFAYTARERAVSLSALRWARRRCNVDENRVFVSGISRGGHLAWDLALRHPDLFAAVMPMVGGPRLNFAQGQNNFRYLENLWRTRICDLQGANDDKGLVLNLRLAFEALNKLGNTHAQFHEQPGHGHTFDLKAVDWLQYLNESHRDPAPPEVVRRYATDGQGRAFWVEVLKAGKEVQDTFSLKVSADRWNAMTEEQQKKTVIDQGEQKTARLFAERDAQGKLRVKTEHVEAARLLLLQDWFVPRKPIDIHYNARTISKKAEPSARVLLREFVERFDRTFLPVAEVMLP